MNVEMPLTGRSQLFGTVAVAHRFEKHGARTCRKMVCVFGLDLAGRRASLSLNAILHGCSPQRLAGR